MRRPRSSHEDASWYSLFRLQQGFRIFQRLPGPITGGNSLSDRTPTLGARLTPRWGATPEEWSHFDLLLGLTTDLLPVVSNPHAVISAQSALKQAGKVPSRYNAAHEVIGLAGWTLRRSTPTDIEQWSTESDYGMSLQTRRVRAIDIDIEDAEVVSALLAEIELQIGVLPCRTRANSQKCLLIFEYPEPMGKRVIRTAHGLIEILADGNQFVACGTHVSGSRYAWADLPLVVPRLDAAQWAALWALLCAWAIETPTMARPSLEGETSTPAQLATAIAEDPCAAYLTAQGLVLGQSSSGRLYVACPWASDHSTQSDVTATAYFVAGTNGHGFGAFDCRHASHTGKTLFDFQQAIGYTDHYAVQGFANLNEDAYATLTYEDPDDLVGNLAHLPTVPSPLDGPRFERDLKSGAIKPLLQNLVLALGDATFCGARLTRDQFRDQLLIDGRPFKDADYTELTLRLVKQRVGPGSISPEMMRAAVNYVAEQAAFDSAIDWLRSLPPWDGVARVSTFCSTYLGTEDSPYSRAVSRYWWTAHAGRVLSPGCQADMAIVLISGQGTGKTSSIKAMVPHHEEYVELSLTDRDQDLSRAMRGKLIGEIAELRGINTRDMEAIKAWVSRQREEWVPKYLEFSQTFPRRLVLVGTSNQEEFLADETGNRRWLPIKVGPVQDRPGIVRDRSQLWAEAATLFDRGGVLWQDAEMRAKAEHGQYEIQDAWLETVREWLHDPQLGAQAPARWGFLRMDDVLRGALKIDIKYVKPYEQLRCGKVLHLLGYVRGQRRMDGTVKKVWYPQNREQGIQ